MHFKEALDFVKEWLWSSPNRWNSMPWTPWQVHDAAMMVMEAVNKEAEKKEEEGK